MRRPLSSVVLAISVFGFHAAGHAASCVRLAQLVADFPPTFAGAATLSPVNPSGAGNLTFDNLNNRSVTDYTAAAAGTYQIAIAVSGFPTLSLSARFHDRHSYTALSSGRLGADPQSAEFADDTLIVDDNTLAGPGKARVRFVHVAPTTDVVDVLVNQQTLYEDIGYKNIGAYRTFTPGISSVAVNQYQTGESLTTAENLGFTEGTVNTLWLLENPFGTPSLRVLHTVDAPNTCSQQDYTGIWYDPDQNGQGVQFNDTTATGGQFGGVWYAYGPDRESAWFTFQGSLQDNQFDGSLLRFTGTPYTQAFDPVEVQGETVGVVSITFSPTTRLAAFEATVDGVATTLDLEPFGVP